jgi:pimeloyl-ACP methyl ester carboxylesterase
MSNPGNNPQPTDLFLSGKRVRVWTFGKGPALLLLHSAWGGAEMSWAPVWNDLSKAFTIIAPDMPGFGASDPTDVPSLAASVLILKDLLDSLKIDRAIVVGNSFGVANALEFTSTFPERTKHLVVVNGANLPVIPAFLKKLIRLPMMERRFRKLMRTMNYSDKAFSKAFPDPDKLPAGFFDRIRQFEDKHSRVVFDSFMNQAAQQKRPIVPVSIIWGTGDRLVPRYLVAKLRKWLGNPLFIPIEGAGHMPQVERPREFVEAMKRVSSVQRTTA